MGVQTEELLVAYDNIFNMHVASPAYDHQQWLENSHPKIEMVDYNMSLDSDQPSIDHSTIQESQPTRSGFNSHPGVVLLSGGTAGAVSRTCTAPMDRLKVMLQAGDAWKGRSVGVVEGLNSIYRESGWLGFFRGNGTNVIKIVPEMSMKFYANELFKEKISSDPQHATMIERFTAGALAGVVAQTSIYPLEIAKTRLAVSKAGQYRGLFDCLVSSVKSNGVSSLYKGLLASIIGVVPYAGTDLAVYTFLRDQYVRNNPDRELGALPVLACGAISCTCGQLVAYPLQLIRTRLQAQDIPGMTKYDGIADCAVRTIRNDGLKGLYRGLLPNFLKALPAITISYVVFEKSKIFWQQYLENSVTMKKTHLIA